MTVLVTGATGYIGGRLTARLVEQGVRVRLVVRDPRRLRGRSWEKDVEIVEGDLLDLPSMERALDGASEAYYLVHSMAAGGDFAERDKIAAHNFVRAGGALRHCVYLGGLVPEAQELSLHLQSRADTGAILRGGLPVTEFRAGPIVGSGSASFEMVRYLTERLPVMLTPRWIVNHVQPIAVRDVLAYLLAARTREALGVVDIGGADRLSFREMMQQYGDVRGLTRVIVAAPLLAPSLAALWINKVTPIPRTVVEPLVEGIMYPVLADTTRAEALFPEIKPVGYRVAVERALASMSERAVESRWSDALGAGATYELRDREGVLEETRTEYVAATPEQLFRAVCKLGGDRGWLAWNVLWRIRGFLDRLVGGPGLRRGRRHPDQLLAGEALDFWRVEIVEPPRMLRLRAEMRLPGKAWLQFTVVPEGDGSRLLQTALFAPRGLFGLLYWYAMYPAHLVIFRDMVRAISKLARSEPPTDSDAAPVLGLEPVQYETPSLDSDIPELRS